MASPPLSIDKRVAVAVERILKNITVDVVSFREGDPFKLLIAVILSQRTSRENVRAALRKFERKFNDISDVARASVREIGEAIRRAGLWKQKAPRIKKIAQQLLEMGGLEKILKLPYEEARVALSSMKGIGPKTADVFLMFTRGDPVFPVDTHISRIMHRLGVAGDRDGYEDLRRKLESVTPPEKRMQAHIALIEFGREICTARSPKCQSCFLIDICQYGMKIVEK
ncbi:MAG: endonuclease III [Nitrososphaeria archaeon]|nr:endonuclease III [Aigarchaeota archaeon]MCX8188028.1 endonuclease III [Nitrososphaeria archaeon]MDW8021620.1 endonuclease III [Nitrososphaerota archaeon]